MKAEKTGKRIILAILIDGNLADVGSDCGCGRIGNRHSYG